MQGTIQNCELAYNGITTYSYPKGYKVLGIGSIPYASFVTLLVPVEAPNGYESVEFMCHDGFSTIHDMETWEPVGIYSRPAASDMYVFKRTI